MTRRLDDFVRRYVETVAPRSEAPERFHYWSAIAAIGGAIRRRCFIDEGMYKVFPNWFIILVGPPGLVKKSTTIDVAMGLLREIEGVQFGANCSTWEGFITDFAAAKDIFAVGGSSASLIDQEYEATNALTMVISEFGTFLDPQNYMMVNVLTDLWDCKDSPFIKKTKTQGTDIVTAPFLNMVAGTTPQWMLQNFKGQFSGWGFSARCIFIHCSKPERYIARPSKLWGDTLHTWKEPFVEDLREIAALEGPYQFAADADDFYESWYHENQDRIATLGANVHNDPWLLDYIGRKPVHMQKLALCLAAGRRDTRVITAADLREAAAKTDEIEYELAYIFGRRVLQTQEVKVNLAVVKDIERVLEQYGNIKEEDIYAYTVQHMAYGRAKELIENLVRARFLRRTTEVGTGATFITRGEGQLSERIEGEVDE